MNTQEYTVDNSLYEVINELCIEDFSKYGKLLLYGSNPTIFENKVDS